MSQDAQSQLQLGMPRVSLEIMYASAKVGISPREPEVKSAEDRPQCFRPALCSQITYPQLQQKLQQQKPPGSQLSAINPGTAFS